MDIKELNLKVDHLAQVRKSKSSLIDLVTKLRNDFEVGIQPQLNEINLLATEIQEIQNELITVLKEAGNKSWRTNKATVSVKTATSFNIVDREKLLAKLNEMKLTKEYTRIEFIPQIKMLFEKQVFDGVEKVEKEFISVIVKKEEGKK